LWLRSRCPIIQARARVAELVDAADLKSAVRKDVPVRVRPRAPQMFVKEIIFNHFFCAPVSNQQRLGSVCCSRSLAAIIYVELVIRIRIHIQSRYAKAT
jgi:hypothetical protein